VSKPAPSGRHPIGYVRIVIEVWKVAKENGEEAWDLVITGERDDPEYVEVACEHLMRAIALSSGLGLEEGIDRLAGNAMSGKGRLVTPVAEDMKPVIDKLLRKERKAGYKILMVDIREGDGCRACGSDGNDGRQFGVVALTHHIEAKKLCLWTVAMTCSECRNSEAARAEIIRKMEQKWRAEQ